MGAVCEEGWHQDSEPHRVDPVEVRFFEALLDDMPEVHHAVTTVDFDEATGRQTLVVYVECASLRHGRTADDVCSSCAQRLKPYGLDTLVLAVLEWPRTPDGHVD